MHNPHQHNELTTNNAVGELLKHRVRGLDFSRHLREFGAQNGVVDEALAKRLAAEAVAKRLLHTQARCAIHLSMIVVVVVMLVEVVVVVVVVLVPSVVLL